MRDNKGYMFYAASNYMYKPVALSISVISFLNIPFAYSSKKSVIPVAPICVAPAFSVFPIGMSDSKRYHEIKRE